MRIVITVVLCLSSFACVRPEGGPAARLASPEAVPAATGAPSADRQRWIVFEPVTITGTSPGQTNHTVRHSARAAATRR